MRSWTMSSEFGCQSGETVWSAFSLSKALRSSFLSSREMNLSDLITVAEASRVGISPDF